MLLTRNNKCLRFRLTLLSLSMRLRNHSHYFTALMSRSYVQLPRRQKLPECYNIMRIFSLKLTIIAMPRDSENIYRLMMNITRCRKCKCIILKFTLQYFRLFLQKYILRFRKKRDIRIRWSDHVKF